jgi:FixJ family two-component response regulator
LFELFQSKAKQHWPTGQGTLFLSNRNAVLVVDDDPGTRRGVKRLLREHGYDSVLFSSAQAFENQVDFADAFCVVLNISLGDQSGIELRYRLKAAGNYVPIIYITANDSPTIRMAALKSGCIAFLTKPFSAQELIEPLKSAAALYA